MPAFKIPLRTSILNRFSNSVVIPFGLRRTEFNFAGTWLVFSSHVFAGKIEFCTFEPGRGYSAERQMVSPPHCGTDWQSVLQEELDMSTPLAKTMPQKCGTDWQSVLQEEKDMSVSLAKPAAEPIDMSRVRLDPGWALRIPASLARRKKVIPCCELNGRVLVACVDLDDPQTLDSVERYLNHPIEAVRADEDSLERLIQEVFGGAAGRTTTVRVAANRAGGEEDAVAICDEFLQAAAIRNGSDVHIDPGADDVRVRLRVDGSLEEYRRLPLELHPLVSSRLKVLGGMDIAERRAPQDGRFAWTSAQGTEIDVRAATLPTRHGEAITLRLLASKTSDLTLETLGMNNADLAAFTTAIHKPHGMVLLTGPTGSGKTTTLYAGIRRLISQRALHVVTVEDPIEYEISGVAQVAVDAADKVSFRKALRSILRHDPDVIMIGEIRDGETADIAIKSSLTGHLVLSTLHTNSAVSAVTRLTDMGVAPYLAGATLRLVVAQRLVRRLCPMCRVPVTLTEAEAIGLDDPSAAGETAYKPVGCIYCAGRGLTGRVGLFEMFTIDEELSRAISTGANESQISQVARQRGFRRLADDARTKVLQGETTAREALSAVTIW